MIERNALRRVCPPELVAISNGLWVQWTSNENNEYTKSGHFKKFVSGRNWLIVNFSEGKTALSITRRAGKHRGIRVDQSFRTDTTSVAGTAPSPNEA